MNKVWIVDSVDDFHLTSGADCCIHKVTVYPKFSTLLLTNVRLNKWSKTKSLYFTKWNKRTAERASIQQNPFYLDKLL